MKQYEKHWLSELHKVQTPQVVQITPEKCIERKLRMSRFQLVTAFECESRSFLAEFRRPTWCDAIDCKEYTIAALKNHIHALYTACMKDYLNLCVFNFCSGAVVLRKATLIKNQEEMHGHSMDDAVATLTDIARFFYAQEKETIETLVKRVYGMETITEKLLEKIAERIRSSWRRLIHKAYAM